jgi:hypothetical protein
MLATGVEDRVGDGGVHADDADLSDALDAQGSPGRPLNEVVCTFSGTK